MQLTPHFAAAEFAVSARYPALVQPVPPLLLGYAQLLATLALEPARAALGRPLRITSGYRAEALNTAVGGSPTSQHLLAQAADVTCAIPSDLFDWLRTAQPRGIGQVIYYPAQRFVHCALISPRYGALTPFVKQGTRLQTVSLGTPEAT